MQCTGVFACRNISHRDHVTSDHSLLAFIVLTFIRLPDLPDSRFFLAYFLSLAFLLFRARFHDIRQQWFRTSMGDCIPFSSGDFKRAWPWHRRWTGTSSPLAAERVETGFDHWRARQSFSQLCVVDQSVHWGICQAIQPSWETQWP